MGKSDKELLNIVDNLVQTMEKGGLVHLKIQDKEGLCVELEKKGRGSSEPVYSMPVHHHPHPTIPHAPAPSAEASTQQEKKEDKGFVQKSPMVGMFYRAAAPGEPPYVKVGDAVTKDSLVCIIEAMKVMNEVKAEKSGTIVEIYAENGHPVEFGSKLFRIE